MKLISISILSLTVGFGCLAQSNNTKSIDALKSESASSIQSGYDAYKKIALSIWDYAEVGFKEIKALLCYKPH
jgi:aminobenzoyl-glutamate utilization protein B